MTTRLASILLLAAAACGGKSTPAGPTNPSDDDEVRRPTAPALVEQVADARWYRSAVPCGQGPYELTVPLEGGRWDEEVTLQLQASHPIALKAIAYGPDDQELARIDGVYQDGPVSAPAQNAKCVADDRERKLLLTPGGGGGKPGAPVPTGHLEPGAPPPAEVTTARLDLDTSVPSFVTAETAARAVIKLKFPTGKLAAGAIIRIKFWSIVPNDLAGVAFGVVRRAWRPNVEVATYDQHLAELAAAHDAEMERLRLAQVEIQRQRALRLQLAEDERRRQEAALTPAQRRARDEAARQRAAADAEANRRAAERQAREDREAAERYAREEREAQLRYAMSVREEAARRAKREAFCAAHHDDRDCWGVGGFQGKLIRDQRVAAREQFCATHTDDARCWSADDRAQRETVWNKRVEEARLAAVPTVPDGPPPAPLAETMPPRLSVHADWRPGYWVWLDNTWVWLAGQWRVPEADIIAETTTEAPAAPPPPQVEVIAVAPARTTVWVAGFWQWSGSQWVWIAGSWQVRPSTNVEWRAPTWRAKGRVHVLVPGAWIRLGGGR